MKTSDIRLAVGIVAGSVLVATSVNCFTAPNRIAPGGVTGLATMLHDVAGTPIGLVAFLLNVPLFFWARKAAGGSFVLRTAAATLACSALMDTMPPLLAPYTSNPLFAALTGGALGGAGYGLILMSGATTGGTDLAAKLLSRRMSALSVGQLILLLDTVVVLLSAMVYRNAENAFYSALAILTASRVVDAVLSGSGGGHGKLVLVMTARSAELKKAILTELGRGVTLLRCRGGFSGEEGDTVLCAVRKNELYRMRVLIRRVDPRAFVIVGTAEQIIGERFALMEEQ